jgi:uncharacterized membrane protein
MLSFLLAIHILAAVFWVGGMAFAYTMLRPAAGPLEPSVRLALWRRVFARFFPWVAISIAALLVSGFSMAFLYFGGMADARPYIHIMAGLGILMMLLFGHLYFVPWRRFAAAVDGSAWPEAGKQLNQIRMIVAINLALGVIVVVVGSAGRYF